MAIRSGVPPAGAQPCVQAGPLATATNVPLWFIAAFEDGKATPDFLAGYEVDCAPLSNRPA
jgi:hypothetical protein